MKQFPLTVSVLTSAVCVLAVGTRPLGLHRMMKTFFFTVSAITHLTFALRPAVHVSRLQQQQDLLDISSSRLFLHRRNTMTNPSLNTHSMLSMEAGDGSVRGTLTRKALLEGVGKAAGVVGAGTFVQKGFFAGVPYHGQPDLIGKVRGIV